MVLSAGAAARADHDPEARDNIEIGFDVPLEGDGPLSPYLFYHWNRPHFPAADLYSRVVVAPTYLSAEVIRDRTFGPAGQALGLGVAGGLFPYGFDDFRDGGFQAGESFTGSGGELSLTYYPHVTIADLLPVEGMVRFRPMYVGYDRTGSTSRRFELPEATPIYTGRTGVRVGGRPPELLPRLALEISLWYEAAYRQETDRYGLPERPQSLSRLTQQAYGRLGGIATLGQVHTVSLWATAGTSWNPDALSTYRLGAALPFRREFPLILHGYFADEIYARRFWLINVSYAFPLWPGSERVQLRLLADWARVDYLKGRALPRRDLRGVGAQLTVRFTRWITMLLGYGYGIDAPRNGSFGGQEASAAFEVRF